MSKKNKNENKIKLSGKEGFEKYYSDIYLNRWNSLKDALLADNIHATWKIMEKENYYLDPASIFAAAFLPLKGASEILDLCAAPGGKTLVIASRMEDDAVLVSNERSAKRKQRLENVCDGCLPESIRNRIKISCSDGAKWCITQNECYDRILLDAPCSSERHVLTDEKYLNDWSISRIKTVCMEQWALLSSAWRLLRTGGYLLYSTCALCPSENDGIISRLLGKFDGVEVVFKDEKMVLEEWKNILPTIKMFCEYDFSFLPEKTEYGFHLLPDMQNGAGPIWWTLLKKTKSV